MIRHRSLLLFLSFFIMFWGCRSTTTTLREQGEVRGKVYVLGNEPFTKLGLALDDEHSVVLLCSPDIDTYLRSHQGGQARVTYDGLSQVPEGQAVRVTKAELVKE